MGWRLLLLLTTGCVLSADVVARRGGYMDAPAQNSLYKVHHPALGIRMNHPRTEQLHRRGSSNPSSSCDQALGGGGASLSSGHQVQLTSAQGSSLGRNLARGALLRIASDLTGGTPLESVKSRVTVTRDNALEAYRNIVREGGFGSLWSGTPSRTIEGALMGALFLVGSSGTKRMVMKSTGSSTLAALCGGFVGGIAQTVVMTPAGMVFTSLNVNKGQPGYENDTAWTVTRRIVKEKGIKGMFAGGTPMAIRQATNWASRSGFTEIARTQFHMSQYGIWGEIGAGIIGGVGSCWNTPIETVRVLTQQDVSRGIKPKSFMQYTDEIVEKDGVPGLFRGVTPRAIQAIWQTVFMVVVPNVLGV